MTPYKTASGVQIGLLYKRPMPSIHGDALRLQSALIDPKTATPLTGLQRIYRAIMRCL